MDDDITPNMGLDPYELFSSPPNDMILSSTPCKPKNENTKRGPKKMEKKNIKKADRKESKKENILEIKKISDNSIRKSRSKKKDKSNLWDKCIKSNPELAQFVDSFNQSLEEATSKPLDIIE